MRVRRPQLGRYCTSKVSKAYDRGFFVLDSERMQFPFEVSSFILAVHTGGSAYSIKASKVSSIDAALVSNAL